MTIAVFHHADCLAHDPGAGHPESPARLSSVLSALKTCDFADRLAFVEAPLGTRDQVLLAHTEAHLRDIEANAPTRSRIALDPDTIMSPGSLQAALRAVGAACAAVDGIVAGKHTAAFCATRPPGHHAPSNRAMGFCLFNQIAVAARHAHAQHGFERVAIVDFDVHHGNGTEAIFARDSNVLYISTHQWPFYPGTGEASRSVTEHILNLPLEAGTDGTRYRRIFEHYVIPALLAHGPEFILVSAGFDAHRDDPLANLGLTAADYRWIGEQIATVAQNSCEGRVVSVLEGGYNLEALAESCVSYLSAFVGQSAV